MPTPLVRALKRLSPLVLIVALVGAVVVGGAKLGLWPIFGVDSSTSNSQVIQAVERTQEVSLVSLHVQGLKDEKRSRTVFGKALPGTSEKVFLQYAFDAKLGIDGSAVEVTPTGEQSYRITIPEFTFIGYEEPTFKVAVEDGSLLSWTTPDIDKVEMINEILNGEERQTYIESNAETLEDQARTFYESLLTSIDPDISTTFEFAAN